MGRPLGRVQGQTEEINELAELLRGAVKARGYSYPALYRAFEAGIAQDSGGAPGIVFDGGRVPGPKRISELLQGVGLEDRRDFVEAVLDVCTESHEERAPLRARALELLAVTADGGGTPVTLEPAAAARGQHQEVPGGAEQLGALQVVSPGGAGPLAAGWRAVPRGRRAWGITAAGTVLALLVATVVHAALQGPARPARTEADHRPPSASTSPGPMAAPTAGGAGGSLSPVATSASAATGALPTTLPGIAAPQGCCPPPLQSAPQPSGPVPVNSNPMAVPTAASTPSASATAPSPTITLSVSPARGGTNGSFTVSGGGCPEAGDQIDIMWDNHALVPEAHCSAAHRFSQTYTPTNGELDWATPAGQYAKWTVTAGSHAIQANNQASTGLFVTETIHYTVTG